MPPLLHLTTLACWFCLSSAAYQSYGTKNEGHYQVILSSDWSILSILSSHWSGGSRCECWGRRCQPSWHWWNLQGLSLWRWSRLVRWVKCCVPIGQLSLTLSSHWSDCDPFELIRFKVLKLITGGSQCEVEKNITKHCTPHDFPFGTHWLIQVKIKCVPFKLRYFPLFHFVKC